MTFGTVVEAVVACAAAYGAFRVFLVYSYRQIYGNPDLSPAFAPLSPGGMIWGLGMTWLWDRRLTAYKDDKDVIRLTPWFWGDSVLYTRSVDVLRQVGGGGTNTTWVKPNWASQAVMLFGKNLISENLGQWKTHRRIMQPAFNTKTYELVWNETSRIYRDMVQTEKWTTDAGSITTIKSLNRLTYKLGLYVISSCGFGLPFAWSDPPRTNGQSSIQSNIETVESHHLSLVYAPKWIWRLPIQSLRNVKEEHDSLAKFIQREVDSRKTLIEEALKNDGEDSAKQDVFSRLVLANLTEGKNRLSDSELIGNTFALLFAGHDTTAGTMAAAIALLAVHQDEQEMLHQEVAQVIEDNGALDFVQYSKLPQTLAVFLEASRLYPAGQLGIRQCLEDTIIKVGSSEHGQTSDIVMPKGAVVIVDFVGMQYNPMVFDDPASFRPSRWEGMTEDSINSFSVGPRACIGKKFAMTEAVCFLSHLFNDFKVEPLLEPGESVDEWKERVLGKINILLTLSITDVPLRLIRR